MDTLPAAMLRDLHRDREKCTEWIADEASMSEPRMG